MSADMNSTRDLWGSHQPRDAAGHRPLCTHRLPTRRLNVPVRDPWVPPPCANRRRRPLTHGAACTPRWKASCGRVSMRADVEARGSITWIRPRPRTWDDRDNFYRIDTLQKRSRQLLKREALS